jgi:hypothetical protein
MSRKSDKINSSAESILTHIDAPIPRSGSLLDWERVVLESAGWPIPTFGGREGAQRAAADAIAGRPVHSQPLLCATCQQPVIVACWCGDGCVKCVGCSEEVA